MAAPKCDPEVYRSGTPIALVANIPARVIEAVVQEAAERSGVRMDWHFSAGRANVLALGDVGAAARELRSQLAKLPIVMWDCDGQSNAVPSIEQQLAAHYDPRHVQGRGSDGGAK